MTDEPDESPCRIVKVNQSSAQLPVGPASGAAQSPQGNPKPRAMLWKLLAGLVLLSLVVGAWLGFRPRSAATEPTATMAELIRLDGRLVWRSATNRVFSGWLVEAHADGTPRSRSWIADGVLNGVSEGWHTNGQIQVREHFVNGIADGLRVRWHANGATQSLATIVRGRIEGRFLRWHEDGSLAEEIEMREGQPDGLSRAYFPSGFVKAEVHLKAGQVVEQKFWKDGERPTTTVGVAAVSGSR